MDSFGGSKVTDITCMKKKRSNVSRKPRLDSPFFSDTYSALPFSLVPSLGNAQVDDIGPRVVSNGFESEKRFPKLKLKLGGVTRTVHAKSTVEVQHPVFQEDVIDTSSRLPHFSSRGTVLRENDSLIKTYECEPARKSRRVPKGRDLDVEFDDDDEEEDDEIRYLGRLKASKLAENFARDKKKNSRSENVHKDNDYVEEEEATSDNEFNVKKRSEMFIEGRSELTLLTRKRAFESGASLLDLPNGLPPAPSRRQKEKLSEVELQLKKSVAIQRRRMQAEKAAKEAEAEAIRKILGQDSSRKKKEDKMKKRRDELAEEKAASNITLAANTVRWVLGPTGTTVTFSEDIGLPTIFNQVRCSYPEPREKCVGPNCTNAYKYRDSKSKLPLCSLHCYKAIRAVQPLMAC